MAELPPGLQSFQPPPAIDDVLQALRGAGHHAYLVGGCIRDLIRGSPPKDFDVATGARPEQVQALFRKVIPTGIQHGTVTVISRGLHVEVTTFRSEGEYLDGRRPSEVTFETDVREDLSRRDFTINAMAFDPIGRELVDPFGGREDLERRLIRAVGSALERFTEDGLRPYRAVRFSAVLGFDVEPQTLAAIPLCLEVSRKVAHERVREEFQRLLLSERVEKGMTLLLETGLLRLFLAESLAAGEPQARTRFAQAQRVHPELEARLALLVPPQQLVSALKRLTFPTKVVERSALLAQNPLPLEPTTDAQLRRIFVKLLPENAEAALAIAAAVHGPEATQPLSAQVRRVLAGNPPLNARALALDGAAIMKTLAVGPGRVVGEATRFLLDQVLDDPSKNTADTLASLLTHWAAERTA